MQKRSFFSFVIFFLTTTILYAQVNLPVNLTGQRGSNLCWSASMKMVLDYYDPGNPESQCTLAYLYKQMRHDDNPFYVLNECNNICTSGCGTQDGDYCNKVLPGNTLLSYTPSLPGNYDLLFSKLGYNSMEDIELLSWDQYKEELEACRPIIFFYSVTGVSNTNIFNHSVVAHGYEETPGGDFFLIKDPWGDCTGTDYLVNKVVLDGQYHPTPAGPDVIQVNQMLGSVHHIFPKDNPECKDCAPDTEQPEPYTTDTAPPSQLIELLKEHQKDFIGSRFGEAVKFDYLKEGQLENHFVTPVAYLSQNYLIDPKPGPVVFEDARVKAEIYEVTYTGSQPALVATLRCEQDKGLCFVEKIGLQSKSETKRVWVTGNQNLILTNNPKASDQTDLPTTKYQIVRYPPYPFEFYRFQYRDQFYWYPIGDNNKYYLYSPKYANVQTAIDEKNLFRGLEKYSKDEYKIQDKGYRQEIRLNRRIDRDKYLKMDRYIRRNDLQGTLDSFE